MCEQITAMSVRELMEAMQTKRLSAREVCQAYLKQLEQREDAVNAYLSLTSELAMEQAKAVDEQRASGQALPALAGVPGGIKDNILTLGVRTSCASKMLENFIPPYDATVMEKLNGQRFVLLGKLNMDEFAMGSSTENSFFKVTHNPRALDRVPGGSSGGSAAAVAAQEAAFALGSDTGGSIRQPAAFCGVVGMKPTYGSVSRYGLVAFASSLDQIGPMTRDVYDSALILNAIAGHDPKDATSVRRDVPDYTLGIGQGVRGLKVALPRQCFEGEIAPEVKEAVLSAARKYEKLGATVEEVDMPALEHALPAYYVISSAEASSNLARFDGVRYGYRAQGCQTMEELYKRSRSEGFGPEVKRRIMLGTFALSSGYYDAYYKKAQQVRTLVMRDYDRIFEAHDVILSPVAPTTAYKIGSKTQDALSMYRGDIFTVPVNIAGVPALSMPCGQDADGLPVGMQLIGRPFSEPLLYRAGYAFEQSEKEGKPA